MSCSRCYGSGLSAINPEVRCGACQARLAIAQHLDVPHMVDRATARLVDAGERVRELAATLAHARYELTLAEAAKQAANDELRVLLGEDA